jgi:DNA polymerase-3 subunit alpha
MIYGTQPKRPGPSGSGTGRAKYIVDLHLHGAFSLLDGLIRPESLMEKCKALGREAVALTDHGAMGGLVEFHKAAAKAGIKALLGVEFYHEKGGANCHLVLLARSREGYDNLVRLNNLSQGNFYKKPRITDQMIQENGKGLILLTACVQGWMAKTAALGNPDWDWFRAAQSWVDYAFLEVQNHGIPEEAVVFNAYENSPFRDLMVGTTDAHYLEASQERAHGVGLAVAMNKREGEFKFNGSGYWVRPDGEIALPTVVLQRTHEVAALVEEYELGHKQWVLPDVEADPDIELRELELKLDDYLLKDIYGGDFVNHDEDPDGTVHAYNDRLKYEFGVISKNGFLPYFKIVADVCAFVDGRGRLRGWGRGSAAGSLVAFLYGITKIDPIKWGLFFERFLNPDRVSPPDIDLDFQPEDRPAVMEYLRGKYGRVYQIGTYTTLGPKECILSCSRAMGVTTRLAEFVPAEAPVPPISEIMKSEGFARQVKLEGAEDFVSVCLALEGLPRNRSAHASGVVIDAAGELPFQVSKSGENAGLPVTSYDMYSLDILYENAHKEYMKDLAEWEALPDD